MATMGLFDDSRAEAELRQLRDAGADQETIDKMIVLAECRRPDQYCYLCCHAYFWNRDTGRRGEDETPFVVQNGHDFFDRRNDSILFVLLHFRIADRCLVDSGSKRLECKECEVPPFSVPRVMRVRVG